MQTGQQRHPLAKLDLTEGVAGIDRAPIPLVGERMHVVIRGLLATVSREQIFRNAEKASIEATMTFPVPVHATLHRLTARIGDQVLSAVALPRIRARSTYESAVEEGKTAVLHEELLRGIHMLSIAHIPAGAEVSVTHSWIAALSPRDGGKSSLRIPVTLGDVYGDSPFNDADDVRVSAGVLHEAEVEIDAGAASATILGHPLQDGHARLRLDAPVDIEVAGASTEPVRGVSADGRAVAVSVFPDDRGDADIDAAILVDRSGSMEDAASGGGGAVHGQSKHDAVLAGLAEAASTLRRRDRTELWQFDNAAERLSGAETPLAEAIGRLDKPRGGTEIGAALQAVVAGTEAGDILLITDGLSHALGVQSLANSGRRFTVVLVGEDSLEVNVGHLAALTGGQMILAVGAEDAGAAVRRAVASLRRSKPSAERGRWPLKSAAIQTGGAIVEARWGGEAGFAVTPGFESAVGALAAAMAIPRLEREEATRIAAMHGLVCHLTSLVLVDEAGATQQTLPAQRKVPLMRARVADMAMPIPVAASLPRPDMKGPQVFYEMNLAQGREQHSRPKLAVPPLRSLRRMAKRIDWTSDPEALRRGDLSRLPREVAAAIRAAATVPEVLVLAGAGGNLVAIIIALMAKSLGWSNRGARRIVKAVLAGMDHRAIARAMSALEL